MVKVAAYEQPHLAPAAAQRASEPAIVRPVVILRQAPVYSDAAGAAGISGTVALKVRFTGYWWTSRPL